MEEKQLTDLELYEILVERLVEKSKEELINDYKSKNNHEKINMICDLAEYVDYDYMTCLENIRKNLS